jgi:hypothetical protein
LFVICAVISLLKRAGYLFKKHLSKYFVIATSISSVKYYLIVFRNKPTVWIGKKYITLEANTRIPVGDKNVIVNMTSGSFYSFVVLSESFVSSSR